jgi:hypothetical protein
LNPSQAPPRQSSASASRDLRVCVASQGKLEKTRLSLELTGLRHPARAADADGSAAAVRLAAHAMPGVEEESSGAAAGHEAG